MKSFLRPTVRKRWRKSIGPNSVLCALAILLMVSSQMKAPHDVNVVGLIGVESTAPLIGATIIDVLRRHFAVNVIMSRPGLPQGIVQGRYKADLPFNPRLVSMNSRDLGPVSILTDVIGYKNKLHYKQMPPSLLKIAYTMFESDRLPSMWVSAINQTFDAVVVPDVSLVKIYEDSGVKKPVFVIPLPVYVEPLLRLSRAQKKQDPFIFGVSAGFSERKNYGLLLEAFAHEYKNNPNVWLKIHGSWDDSALVRNKINELGLRNVEVIDTLLSRQQYISFLRSLDCYVYLSMGEGYSLTPREAVALGIPIILSDHTVHKVLGSIPSIIMVPARQCVKAHFPQFGEQCGCFRQCALSEVCQAMRTMHRDYATYFEQAQTSRQRARAFSRDHLAPLFKTLVSPESITLGEMNSIKNGAIVTRDKALLEKYNRVNQLLKRPKKGQ